MTNDSSLRNQHHLPDILPLLQIPVRLPDISKRKSLIHVRADPFFLHATQDVLRKYQALWFTDESFVVTRQRP